MSALFLSVVSGSAVVSAIIWLIVAGLIMWLLLWLVDYVGLPEPFNKVAKVIIAVFAVLVAINAILSLAGSPIVAW